MYDNLESGTASTYAEEGQKVIAVYHEKQKEGASRDDTIAAMENKINELGPTTVSRHCSNNEVFDIDPSSVSDQAAFVKTVNAAKADGTVLKFLHPGYGNDLAYHIELAP